MTRRTAARASTVLAQVLCVGMATLSASGCADDVRAPDASPLGGAGSGVGGVAPASGGGGLGAGGGTPNDQAGLLSQAERAILAELSPATLPPAPKDTSNTWADDARAAAFGQRLFFDPSFSGRLLDGDNDGSPATLGKKGDTGRVACAGCHLPSAGFSDARSIRQQISLGAGWGQRRAPSLLDSGQGKLLMWDGSRDSLYSQIFGVIESPVEMNSSRLFAAQQVFWNHRAEYEGLFGPMPALGDVARFPKLDATTTGCAQLDETNSCSSPQRGAPGDGAEFDHLSLADQNAVTGVIVNMGKAIGAYERLLTCGPGRFDQWVHGDASALSAPEQRGAALFIGKGRCVKCHSGPFLSDEKFHNVGLRAQLVATVFLNPDDPGAAVGLEKMREDPLNVRGTFSDGDDGRIPSEVGPEFLGAFRTPRLRCGAKRPSFMHTGQLKTLESVVAFFNRAGDLAGYPGVNELVALKLSESEISDLVAFLLALDGPGPSSDLLTAR